MKWKKTIYLKKNALIINIMKYIKIRAIYLHAWFPDFRFIYCLGMKKWNQRKNNVFKKDFANKKSHEICQNTK